MERRKINSKCTFIGLRNNRLNYKCKECGKRCFKSTNRLIKNFPNMYQFCNGDINKFVLLLRKGVYPYEYMDSWERFNETSLPDQKAFYSEFNSEDITDKDDAHSQEMFKELKLKSLRDYLDLHVQFNTLLLADYLKTLETSVLKYTNLILLIFSLHQD